MASSNCKRPTIADQHLLSFLVRMKRIENEQAEQLQRWAIADDLGIIQALAAREILGEDEVAAALASGLRLPLLDLDTAAFDEQVSVYVKDEMAARCICDTKAKR